MAKFIVNIKATTHFPNPSYEWRNIVINDIIFTQENKLEESHWYYLYITLKAFDDEKAILSFRYRNPDDSYTELGEDVVIKENDNKVIEFPLIKGNSLTLEFKTESYEKYRKDKEEKEYRNSPEYFRKEFENNLRKQGNKELKDYKLIVKEEYSEIDAYSQGNGKKETEYAVIEGNKLKSQYQSWRVFYLVKIVNENTIVLNNTELEIDLGKIEITEDQEVSLLDKGGGGHTNDGSSFWSIKISAVLKKR